MQLSHTFPAPATLAEVSVERLREIGLTNARARTIRDFARAYADEVITLDAAANVEDLTATLESLPGIGPWTAQLMALRAAGHPDAFPAGDRGLRRATARLTNATTPTDPREVAHLAESWRPHRALAALHLWMSKPSEGG